MLSGGGGGGAPMGGFNVGPTMRPPPTHPHGSSSHASSSSSSAYVGGLGTSGIASASGAGADPSSTFVPMEVARLVAQLSRNHPERVRKQFAAQNANGRRADAWGEKRGAGLVLEGRIVLNLWRILRTEVKLNTYTFESCAWNILAQRVPRFAPRALSDMYGFIGNGGGSGCGNGGGSGSGSGSVSSTSGSGASAAAIDPVAKHACVAYALRRAQLNIALIDKLDIVGRTSELARVFGQDFTSVLARGSQYRVESMLVCVRWPHNSALTCE
jgi:hypothetical protein